MKEIQYPKLIVNENFQRPFRIAVIHGTCISNRDSERRTSNHMYSIGFFIGWMNAAYQHRHAGMMPKQSIYELVLDEAVRLSKALDNVSGD